MMNQNPTHQDVINMLRDQWPASIDVGDANKEASGKAVNLGPDVMGHTKERSLKIGGVGAEEPIKCLEMRAKIKSARQINKIPFFFHLYLKIWHYLQIPKFWWKFFFWYFKSQISNGNIRVNFWVCLKDFYSFLSNK